jgi:hypothetical protein
MYGLFFTTPIITGKRKNRLFRFPWYEPSKKSFKAKVAEGMEVWHPTKLEVHSYFACGKIKGLRNLVKNVTLVKKLPW